MPKERLSPNPQDAMLLLSGSATGLITCCKLDSTLCIETSKELRTRLAEVVYVEYADQSLTKQLVTCSMDTAYPPIRNTPFIHANLDNDTPSSHPSKLLPCVPLSSFYLYLYGGFCGRHP